MSAIYLVRHGRTRANALRLYCGSTDLPLSDEGFCELRDLRAAGGYPARDGLKLYTSGMLRARQTLAALYGDIPCAEIPGLREMDFGKFEMRSYDEMKEEPAYLGWITDESGDARCPGGESANGFKARVFRAFDGLAHSGEDCLVVCHGGAIANILARAFPEKGRNFYEWQPGFGRGYAVRIEGGAARGFAEIPNRELWK